MYSFVKQKARGMSLVEAIVVIAIFTIMSLVISNSIDSFYKFNSYTIAQSYQVSEARRGLKNLIRDIREMTYADDGAFPLIARGSTTISFYSDVDRDDSVELIEYELATTTTTLYKYIYDAAGTPPVYGSTPSEAIVISRYVQNDLQGTDIFTYFNENGMAATSTTLVTDIRYVGVNLIINIDPVRDPGEFSLRSSASLRNLVENL